MPIIGHNVIEISGSVGPSLPICVDIPTYQYTAVAGDSVNEFWWYGIAWAVASIDFAIYTVSGGFPVDRVGSIVNYNIVTGGVPRWRSEPASIALTAGITYCLCILATGNPTSQYDWNTPFNGSEQASAPMADPWTHNRWWRGRYSAYANVVNVAPPTTSIFYPCRAQLIE